MSGAQPLGAPVADQRRPLREVIDGLCAVDPQGLADGQSVIDLHRELARLDAVATRAAAAFDASREWDSSGAHTAASWIGVECKLPSATARRRVRLGRALRHMAGVESQWLAGEINDSHVGLLAKAFERAPAPFADSEVDLVDWAVRLRFGSFARAMAYWVQRADPDGCERDARKQHDSRRANLSQSLGGMWFLDALFDQIGGEIFHTALKRIDDELFAADWADAKARVGDKVCAADLRRTAQQRRADALVEMARRAMATPAGSRLPEPLFTVYVDYETLAGRMCELASGTVVSPGSLLPWLTRAHVERVVFDSPSRVVDVGVPQRLYTGATRRAVEVHDRQCFHDYCDRRAGECQVDHVQPYSEGGLTTEANGRMACGPHNRRRNRQPRRNENRGPPE